MANRLSRPKAYAPTARLASRQHPAPTKDWHPRSTQNSPGAPSTAHEHCHHWRRHHRRHDSLRTGHRRPPGHRFRAPRRSCRGMQLRECRTHLTRTIAALDRPGMPRKWLRQWGDAHAAMRLGPRLGWGELSWIGQWMRASRGNRSAESRLQLQQLITYSMGRLHQLRQRHALEFDTSTGHLLLIRTPQEHKGLQARLGSLREAGLAFRELNADEARKLEPALNPDSPIEAAIHLPQDEVGNARQFALMIKSEAMRLGVKFEFNSAVD